MIKLRQVFYFRAISGILIFFFLVQIKGLPVTEIELKIQFNKAKVEYISAKYKEAKVRLERLAPVYETIKERTDEMKNKYGQIIFLLGACHERTYNLSKAEEYYKKGFKESPDGAFILESEKSSLPIYRKVYKELFGVFTKDGNYKNK